MGTGDPSGMELRPSFPDWNLIAIDVSRELSLLLTTAFDPS
jgi:hypothetical protein